MKDHHQEVIVSSRSLVNEDGETTLEITCTGLTVDQAQEISDLTRAPLQSIVVAVLTADGGKLMCSERIAGETKQ